MLTIDWPTQLIFIGDSTNRGMMDTIVEQLDGALTSSEKLHSFNHQMANSALTSVTFEYYPKFWQEPRTSFRDALVQTLRRFALLPLCYYSATTMLLQCYYNATKNAWLKLRNGMRNDSSWAVWMKWLVSFVWQPFLLVFFPLHDRLFLFLFRNSFIIFLCGSFSEIKQNKTTTKK